MSRLPFASRLAVLAVLLALAAPLGVSAAPHGSGAAAAARSAPNFSRLWSWLVSLWGESAVPTPAAPASDSGCAIDPGGHCNPGPASPVTDSGCAIDPWGVCTTGG